MNSFPTRRKEHDKEGACRPKHGGDDMKLDLKGRCLEGVREVVSRLHRVEDMCKLRHSSRVVYSGRSPPESWASYQPLKVMVALEHKINAVTRTLRTG